MCNGKPLALPMRLLVEPTEQDGLAIAARPVQVGQMNVRLTTPETREDVLQRLLDLRATPHMRRLPSGARSEGVGGERSRHGASIIHRRVQTTPKTGPPRTPPGPALASPAAGAISKPAGWRMSGNCSRLGRGAGAIAGVRRRGQPCDGSSMSQVHSPRRQSAKRGPAPRWMKHSREGGRSMGRTTHRSAVPAKYRSGRLRLVAEPVTRVDMSAPVFDRSERRCHAANPTSLPHLYHALHEHSTFQ